MGSPGYTEPATERMRAQTGSMVQSAADQVQHAPQAIADQARGNPVAAGLIAFGAGLLLATVLPSSRTEQRLVDEAKPQLQGAADQLKEAGRSVAADAKDHAREAVDEVKAVGSDATSNVKDQAKSSTKQVKDDAGS